MTERPTLTSTTIASQIRDPRVRAPVTLFVPPTAQGAHARPLAPTRPPAHTRNNNQNPLPTAHPLHLPEQTLPYPPPWGRGCSLVVTGFRTLAGVVPPALDGGGRRRFALEA